MKVVIFSVCLLLAGALQSGALEKKPKVDRAHGRTIQGTVRDTSDNPVDGAVVALKDLKTGKTVEFITKQNGTFSFTELNLDLDYQVSARAPGLAAGPKKVSMYDSRPEVAVTLQLEPVKTP